MSNANKPPYNRAVSEEGPEDLGSMPIPVYGAPPPPPDYDEADIGSRAAPAYGCPPYSEDPLYHLDLEGYADKIPAIRGLREVTGCGLPGAVELLERVPVRLLENADAEDVRETASKLEKWGWTVEIRGACR